ncbi:TPA: DUF1642 domain-containing protein [Streptococcus suis]
MNKKEAINYIKNMDYRVRSLEKIYKIISQIDQPQQVVVPAFIDSFIRYTKAEGMSLFIAMDNAQNKESEWIITNEDTFARAWLDGYETEQEKLYTVEIPNPNNTSANVLYLRKDGGKIHISKQNYKTYKQSRYCQLTESEIKQDFEWAWRFAKVV